MPTLRVFQVAKLLKIDSEEIFDALSDMGISVTSNLAPLDESIVAELKELFKPKPMTAAKPPAVKPPAEKKPAATSRRGVVSARTAPAEAIRAEKRPAAVHKKAPGGGEERPAAVAASVANALPAAAQAPPAPAVS